MGKSHVLAIPYPAQGHVIPLLELVQRLVKQGFKVTFVNTDFTHKRVINALPKDDNIGDLINLVSIADGLEDGDNRSDRVELVNTILKVMPGKLEELVQQINEIENDKITCIIADYSMAWAQKVAENMGIRRVSFWPAAAAVLGSIFSIPKLIDDNIINNKGTIKKKQMIQLSPTMPPMNPAEFIWACIGDLDTKKILFNFTVETAKFLKLADWIIGNSSFELKPAAFTLFPDIVPIGPLLASNRLGKQAGYFWPEDSPCLAWLDQQPPCSVVYVAFGSFTVFLPNPVSRIGSRA